MSTIRVDNFGPSAGGTTYSARGIAKAWVNFDGTGTIAARDSENVSSLTDNGVGNYFFNLSSATASTSTSCAGSSRLAVTANSPYDQVYSNTTSQIGHIHSENATATDSAFLWWSIFGDLA